MKDILAKRKGGMCAARPRGGQGCPPDSRQDAGATVVSLFERSSDFLTTPDSLTGAVLAASFRILPF
jgi:hypothetical protein